MQEKLEVVDVVDENKEDWKGRRALKLEYGGMSAAVLVLGNEKWY